MTEVKICGLQDTSIIRVAAEAGADWVGFVLFPASPRNVLGSGPDALGQLVHLTGFAADLGIRSTVLMVDPSPELVQEVLDVTAADSIQLHGNESQEQVLRYARDIDGRAELWKALRVRSPDTLADLEDWYVDRFLFDAPPLQDGELPGGNGECFDWDMLAGIEVDRPWFLAGGLTPDNVISAVLATNAPAVDVSSGVEGRRGVKDEDLIHAFIEAAKST
ncbi:MAG: phosphoribosylanthranilate isomerase [Henriciella sp.]